MKIKFTGNSQMELLKRKKEPIKNQNCIPSQGIRTDD